MTTMVPRLLNNAMIWGVSYMTSDSPPTERSLV
jgi:hypothetical protein